MIDSGHFMVLEDHAVFRPTGQVSLTQAAQLVASAINLCRERGIPKLLVVTTALTGFEAPSLATRYFVIHEWLRAAGGAICIALVAKPEMLDPENFSVIVARNIGLKYNIFTSEPEAESWLQSVKRSQAPGTTREA